jgi:hypothetical protein
VPESNAGHARVFDKLRVYEKFTKESVAADAVWIAVWVAVRNANVTFFDAVLAGLTSVCGKGAAIVVVNALESVAADAASHKAIATFFQAGPAEWKSRPCYARTSVAAAADPHARVTIFKAGPAGRYCRAGICIVVLCAHKFIAASQPAR